jgi:hypothetical protein
MLSERCLANFDRFMQAKPWRANPAGAYDSALGSEMRRHGLPIRDFESGGRFDSPLMRRGRPAALGYDALRQARDEGAGGDPLRTAVAVLVQAARAGRLSAAAVDELAGILKGYAGGEVATDVDPAAAPGEGGPDDNPAAPVDVRGMDASLAAVAGEHFARIGMDGWAGTGPRRRGREAPMSRGARLALDQIAPGFRRVGSA